MKVLRFYSFVVEFGKGCRAYIPEEPKAVQFATTHENGIIREVYVREEIETKPADLDTKAGES